MLSGSDILREKNQNILRVSNDHFLEVDTKFTFETFHLLKSYHVAVQWIHVRCTGHKWIWDSDQP